MKRTARWVRLDYLVVTAPHSDEVGGLGAHSARVRPLVEHDALVSFVALPEKNLRHRRSGEEKKVDVNECVSVCVSVEGWKWNGGVQLDGGFEQV
jgi:hypothetical protein